MKINYLRSFFLEEKLDRGYLSHFFPRQFFLFLSALMNENVPYQRESRIANFHFLCELNLHKF